MGTHPIFESDFDCLTYFGLKILKMSASLQWAIINKFNAKDIKKSGITWSKEAGHLKGKKSFKYSTLVNPGAVTVAANADGGVVLSTRGNKKANKPAASVNAVAIIRTRAPPTRPFATRSAPMPSARITSVPPSRRPPPSSSHNRANKLFSLD